MEKTVFSNLVKDEKTPMLVNAYLRPFYRLLPKNEKYFAKSLAIVPLVLDGELIGSLNLGDFSGNPAKEICRGNTNELHSKDSTY